MISTWMGAAEGMHEGERFGRLVIIDLFGPGELLDAPDGRAWARVRCDCGKRLRVAASELKRGRTKSCGCLMLEHVRLGYYTRRLLEDAA